MNNIKKIRLSAALTQTEMARMLGVSQGTLARYELGIRTISLEMSWKIANILNQLGAECSFEDVFPNPMGTSQ